MNCKIGILIVLVLTLVACTTTNGKPSESSNPINEKSTYEAYVMINGEVLSTVGELNTKNKYTPDEKLGIIEQKLAPPTLPIKNFTSNYFEVGTEIYSTVEDPNIFLGKNQDGHFEIIE